MKFRNKKQAYTLAEIMLVILVLTIIFAAMAPIFTKRKITQYTGKYNVWTYLDRTNFDAFYDPGDPSFTGQLFFGITPSDSNSVTSEFLPLSKIIIRAGQVTHTGELQRHIQFRYGRTDSNKNGTYAGSWYVNRKNILLGGTYKDLNFNESGGARDNVAVGYEALTSLVKAQGNVAVGYNALKSVTHEKNNVAIGSRAGEKNKKNYNVFVGSQAGLNATAEKTVAIGYKAGLGATSQPQNLIIGAFAGGGGVSSGTTMGIGNTAIGYGALGKLGGSSTGNVAIGYNALTNLESGDYNIAIGYNACSELQKGSYKTCIGYNSGPKKKSSSLRTSGSHNAANSGSAFLLWDGNTAKDDKVERVYIGGTPRNFGGDAVLEIHNPTSLNTQIGGRTKTQYQSNTTTVINGNLIVRGRPFFTVGNTLHHFHNASAYMKSTQNNGTILYTHYGYYNGSEQQYAKCTTSDTSYSFGKCPNLNTTSDRRLKNISDRNYAGIKELRKLKVYNFTFKDDKTKRPQVGVLAQELQKVFPNSVFKDEDGYLKIKWDEMFFAAINAIKELDQKIVTLVKRTTKVETQLTKLEKENIELKAQVENLTARVQKLKTQ